MFYVDLRTKDDYYLVQNKLVGFYFKAINSVHFCSVTLRSNQMRYFYYLKLKTIYNLLHSYISNRVQFF